MGAHDDGRAFLRHTVATLAYRGGKVLRDAPAGFADFRAGDTSRSAGEILAHIGDLLDWAHGMVGGRHVWKPAAIESWDSGGRRFFDALAVLDADVAGDEPLGFPAERIFQGPVADALAHVGQIAYLRRLAGAPVRGENYFKADIVAGRVSERQTEPRVEFD
jgi:hypothetical protein